MAELVRRELVDHDEVKFTAKTDQYGLAEFSFCPIYKRGKLVEMFIYPKQQPDVKEYFHVDLSYGPDSFMLGSWTHKGMSEPWVWFFKWCKEHKCQSFIAYAPPEATSFQVSCLSTFSIHFSQEAASAGPATFIAEAKNHL